MNIFFLDKSPEEAAIALCNKHILKMGIEACQLMSAAHYICPGNSVNFNILYNLSWHHHPCSKWVRESLDNYEWTLAHAQQIFNEYTYRYGKVHHCVRSGILHELFTKPTLPKVGFTTPHLGMPDDCKSSDFVESYRQYYQRYKVGSIDVRYTKRNPPNWLKLEK